MLEKNNKVPGEKEVPVTLFCFCIIDLFLLNLSILKAINSAEFAVESIISRTPFPFSRLTNLLYFFLLTCDLAPLFQFF